MRHAVGGALEAGLIAREERRHELVDAEIAIASRGARIASGD